MTETTPNNKSDVSRHRDNDKFKPDWPRWFKHWQASELLPVIPVGGKLTATSKINPALLGKVPGTRGADGLWSGFGGSFAKNFNAELADIKTWHASGASIGMQARIFSPADLDIEHAAFAKEVHELTVKHLGDAAVRYREGSHRRLLQYCLADGETPFRKRRVKFLIDGKEHAVELLGFGQYYNVEGPHPKGGQYFWDNGHPCERGPQGTPQIKKAMVDAFFAEFRDLLDVNGYPVVAENNANDSTKKRTGLDDPKHWAPSPEAVLELLRQYRPEHHDHDIYVQHLAAIKASLGPHRDEFKGEVLEWSPGVRSTEPDQFETRWASITDSSLGWSWLCGEASTAGYHEDAQADFDDHKITPEQAGTVPDPNGMSPIDKMVREYAWVQQQERYMHLPSMEMVTATAVNAANTDVAEFGKTGTNSAAAQLHNHPHALKVVMTTYRPGQPTLIKDYNKRGILVAAVNQWRRSNVVPAMNVTDDGVRLWLNHVVLIFGPLNGPAARHFLDWCAFVLQNPGVKIGHCIVVFGETHGTGKDTVFVPFFRAVGEHNVSTITPAMLAEPWTYYLLAQLVRVEEMMNFKRGEVANKLKPMLTTPPETVTINEKNVKQYDIPNIQNWVMFTNHENAIPIEDTDRRYWIHRCVLDAPREPAYYAALYAWYGSGGTEKVAGWLMQRDVSAFNPMAPPPDTDAKREMQELSLPPAVRWVRTLFAEGRELSGRSVWTVPAVLKEAIRIAASDFNAPSSAGINHKSIASALKLAGFKQTHRARIDGADANVWTRDPTGEMASWSPAQIRNRYVAEQPAREVKDQAA